MEDLLPDINQVISLYILSCGEDGTGQEYKSRIADVSDDALDIQIPIHETTGRLKRLHIGDELEIVFIAEGGMKYYFPSRVLGYRKDNIDLIRLKKPEPGTVSKIQRRSFLRVPAQLELIMEVQGRPAVRAITEDISGGGVSFRCPGELSYSQGGLVEGRLKLPQSMEEVRFAGHMVRRAESENGKPIIIVQFAEIAERDRQSIIRYCFKKQIDIRKR